MATDAAQIDTHIQIVTPENIAFQYRVSGPFRRLGAWLIDVVIRAVAIILVLVVLLLTFGVAQLPGFGFGLALVFWFVLSWFYGGLFEAVWNGQTPGKRLVRLRVMSVDGQPITPLQAVLRNVLRVVDGQPLGLYQLGLLSMALTERFQRLGDLACGTMVVIEEVPPAAGVIRVRNPQALALAAHLPAAIDLSRSAALALSSYILRRESFGPARRVEVARHLSQPLAVQLGLSPQIDPDVLLCAVYHRTFFSGDDEGFSGDEGLSR